MQQIQQAFNKRVISIDKQIQNAKDYIQNQLIMFFDQNVSECYYNTMLSVGKSNVASRLTAVKNSEYNNYYLSQSSYLNGESYTKLPLQVKSTKMTFFQTE